MCSPAGQKELEDLFGRVVHLTDNLVAAFELSNEEHLAAIKEDANGIIAREEQMRFFIYGAFTPRFRDRDTSPIRGFTNAMRRIADHTSSLSRTCPASQANLP